MSAPSQNLFHRLPSDARILFVRLRSMGDCLILTSALRALKSEFPGFRLAVLAESRFAPCFEGNPDVSDVLEAGSGKLQTICRLLGERFAAVINLHGGPTSLIYSLAARGTSYGLDDYAYGFLYRGLIPRGDTRGHTAEATLRWFRWLGIQATEPPALRYASQRVAEQWVREKVGNAPYAVIHPATIMESKRWAAPRFRALGQMLNGRGWKVIVTAGPGEEDIAREAATDVEDSLMLLGLTLPQLAELLRGADLYIGNDSGPMHLAAAVGTPTVAVWGSSNAARWHPWKVAHRVVRNPFECNPCAGYRCHVADTPLCVESVTVDQVAEAVWSLAEESGKAPPLEVNCHNEVQ